MMLLASRGVIAAFRHFAAASLLAVAFAAVAVCSDDREPVKLDQKEIDALIARLGNDDFLAREQATRSLRQHEEALPSLRRAAKSDNAEIRNRAVQLIEQLQAVVKKRELSKLLARCGNGEVDRLIAQMVESRESIKEEHWQGLVDLADVILKNADKESKPFPLTPKKFMSCEVIFRLKPKIPAIDQQRLIVDELNTDAQILNSAIVCGGTLKTSVHVLDSMILAGGNVHLDSHMYSSLIVCDGNVTFQSHVIDSVIIARGKVTLHSHRRNVVIIENETKPLGILKFFDPADLGLECGDVEGKVRVSSVLAGKPFAKAGVQKDDVIAAINGVKVSSSANFRQELRRQYWSAKEVKLTLQRGEKPVDLTVKFLE